MGHSEKVCYISYLIVSLVLVFQYPKNAEVLFKRIRMLSYISKSVIDISLSIEGEHL